jgi:hypothetical protein
MSQKKVEQYKEYKKNKEQILKREKRMKKLEYGAIIGLCCLFVGWFGYSVYDSAVHSGSESTETVQATEVDMNAYGNYVNSLQTGFTS